MYPVLLQVWLQSAHPLCGPKNLETLQSCCPPTPSGLADTEHFGPPAPPERLLPLKPLKKIAAKCLGCFLPLPSSLLPPFCAILVLAIPMQTPPPPPIPRKLQGDCRSALLNWGIPVFLWLGGDSHPPMQMRLHGGVGRRLYLLEEAWEATRSPENNKYSPPLPTVSIGNCWRVASNKLVFGVWGATEWAGDRRLGQKCQH